MRVYAKVYLVEAGKSYRPGDEITDGQLFEQATYYAKIGQVVVKYDTKEPVAVVTKEATWQDADQEKTFQNALAQVTVTKDNDKPVSKPVRRGRPKKQ